MKTLEDHIISRPDSGQVWQDIKQMFSDAAGQRVLEALCSFRHPFISPMDRRADSDPCHTAFICGQKDIISTLVRFSLDAGGQPQFNPHSVNSNG